MPTPLDRGRRPEGSYPPSSECWGQVRDSTLSTDLANCDVLEADGDSAKSLPKTDVEPEFPKRLLFMKCMGQFDDDGPIVNYFGVTFVAAQEGGEVLVKSRFAQPQTDH